MAVHHGVFDVGPEEAGARDGHMPEMSALFGFFNQRRSPSEFRIILFGIEPGKASLPVFWVEHVIEHQTQVLLRPGEPLNVSRLIHPLEVSGEFAAAERRAV